MKRNEDSRTQQSFIKKPQRRMLNDLGGVKGVVAKGIPMFFLHYLILLGIIFLFMIYYDPVDWSRYIVRNLNGLFYMVICLFLLFIAVFFYYFSEKRDSLQSPKQITAIFCTLDLCVILSCFLGKAVHIYARPVALMSLLCFCLFSKRESIFWTFLFAILMLIVDTYTNYTPDSADGGMAISVSGSMYSSLITSVTAGLFAIFLASRMRTRLQFVLLCFPIMCPIELVLFLLEIGRFSIDSGELLRLLCYGALGGVFSTIFFTALVPIFEAVFNILTMFRVRELTSSEAKLLRKLKEEASGTFNHVLIVSQLAEMCAASLNENTELARAAALYHDMGKLSNPDFFTENQKGGVNPHDELSPELSADIIRSHTRDGYELILAHGLPQIFADVAIQHHGTMPIMYFYNKAQRLTDGVVNQSDFSYPGPKPQTKIAAIIMVADAAEAASRNLSERTVSNVERVVRDIIEERVDLDQFSECDITMRELEIIKKSLVFSLTGVYHHRVVYPAISFKRADRAEKRKRE